MRPHALTIVVLVAALSGFGFAAFSTYDFVAHLDRQVHGIHCSFLPGLESADISGSSGCHVTLMSPYSSVFRDSIWGGIPVSLPAMSVFAFLAFWTVYLIGRRRQDDPSATAFLALATALPVCVSAAMAYIAFSELDAACKLCIGIYASSGVAFLAALALWWRARRRAASPPEAPEGRPAPLANLGLATAFGVGILFVALPVAAYAASAPDFGRFIGSCGTLGVPVAEDLAVPLGPQTGSIEIVEVFDPLCPACRGFERRFEALVSAAKAKRRLMLFPLDDECNWMVDRAMHPGACTVSEAILCAGDRADEVIAWAFDHQEDIRRAAEDDPAAAKTMVTQAFPNIADCVGSPAVQAQLNLALRWAVANQLPVLTPQVYVGGVRMCDEDTDLGMDWALTRLIDRAEREGPVIASPPPDEVPEWRRREPVVERPATIRRTAPTAPAAEAAVEGEGEGDEEEGEAVAGAEGEGAPGDGEVAAEGADVEPPAGGTPPAEGGTMAPVEAPAPEAPTMSPGPPPDTPAAAMMTAPAPAPAPAGTEGDE